MMRALYLSALTLLLVACGTEEPAPEPAPSAEPEVAEVENAPAVDPALSVFLPALAATWDGERSQEETARVDLGRHLYYEKRLSSNDSIACNSCHLLDQYGVDGVDFSVGVPGEKVPRNSPTVYNAFGHLAQFWDGRAKDVEEQAKGPILAGKEMGMPSGEAVVAKLKGIEPYPALFAKAFAGQDDPLTYDNVGNAIGAFERHLATPGRFDAFLNGDSDALSADEQKGLGLFVSRGCVTCHTGTFVGGGMYQKLGAVQPWPNQADQGRFHLTENEADKMVFKVPSLRNIAKTGPYFHDASATTLEDAVTLMARHQLGVELAADELASLVAFLGALTGPLPTAYIEQQALN